MTQSPETTVQRPGPDNAPANARYASLGGERREAVMWDYRYTAG